MKIPYNCLQPSGNVIFAARGGKIHSFSLQDGSHISTWKHPDVEKVTAAATSVPKTEILLSPSELTPSSPANKDSEPPAKRQKTGNGDEDEKETKDSEEQKDGDAMAVDELEKPEQQKRDRRKGNKRRQNNREGQQHNHGVFARVPDYPVITIMTATSDGRHLLAISGHDKSLWVFEHDGKGQLKELSQRQMPKRPCSVLICPDNQTILSADKFGDVYSLPLIPSESTGQTEKVTDKASSPVPPNEAPKPFKPEANNFTVHSKSNLRALQNQQREMHKAKRDIPKDQPTFEHTLQIGHVSMLTALTLASKGTRQYIITADRDEHIRISRFMPHAHIIEGFCLGHANFVSALTLPTPDLLVSGGGDNELFVWDWEASRVLSKFNLLEQVQQVHKDATKLAVSQLLSISVTSNGQLVPVVLAVCESVSAIFVLGLSEPNTLSHVQTISLSGNPLYVAQVACDSSQASVLVAIDPADNSTGPNGIVAFKWTGAAFSSSQDVDIQDAAVSKDEFEMSHEQVRKLLYNVNDLRKIGGDEQGEQGDEAEQEPQEEAS
ncbi:tRNA (guanine-N(7)-)-methyltransferase non-catalytic subunit trm82 [Colletotrichum chlorophyti]|uniref:tRNA (Guanine-N(7)-)-methyltransferase non-catalytic subunit trm82 n=1 Tax=Colletotrichum chlorophyti TaxID=708187 RepID=A0A1Q8RWK3_9PEZI|nr:tRNA (guanine-N(7)-)-methyltransferase non-catalytic subunit trm82 [Colletotrichum chlorophyti]